ncbi:putative B3 domain-containing protein At3g49610 [Lycium ferocissimum]|uniref:putative B3 domain-containing protein At3g49610 n=1 Tax=Lycium ferocissimum TaxID=112874 RepID=UPI00281672C4|nr:putative B3 domain-containing protein At3g49610 [Lycium ferocissimum]
MPTIRLFGKDIEAEEEQKSIKLFGQRIFLHATLNNNNNQQHYNRCIYLPPPNMFEAIQFVRGSRLVYIGRKKAENSDINRNLARFFIPATYTMKILNDLTESERKKIENEDNEKGLKVSIMDPLGNFHDMNFTRWKSLDRLVFNRGWNKLVAANELLTGDTVDLWHFRTGSQLCFAINIIKN